MRDWSAAPGLVARSFRAARTLGSHERRFVGEALFGLIRWRRYLGAALGRPLAGDGSDRAPPAALYLAWLWRELGPSPVIAAELAALGLDANRLEGAEARIAAIADPVARIGTRESYPDWLVARLIDERGEAETAALLQAMNRRAPLSARANRIKNTREELAERLAEEGVASQPSPLAPDGLTLLTHVNAYGLAAFRAGRFELQDEASQLVAELVAPPPRGHVVDACAGAGGKTLALGALLGNRGRITAFDPSAKKLEELRARARRAGLTNVHALEIDPELPSLEELALHGRVERVLCDVPCSGVGTLRRNPEARWRLAPRDLDELPPKQARILERYARLVRPGGRLVYATCTVSRRENDDVVDAFLAAHDDFVEVPAKEILGGARAAALGDGTRLRLLPHVHDSDGFFAAVLRRRG